MTYTKGFDEKKYEDIRLIVEKLDILRTGEELSSEVFSSRYELVHCRWLVYDFLSHMGIKRAYRVSTDLDNNCLHIRRISLNKPAKVSVHRAGIHSDLEGYLSELVALDNQAKAERTLSEWVDSRRITPAELGILLTELRRIMA